MESVYYLTHPRIDKAAVVYAPSTEKARTTFLDWLERNNIIRRAHRNFFRKDMIAERIEDPNVPCDVVLNYGYQDFSGRFDRPLVDPTRLRVVSEEKVEFDPETMGPLITSLGEYRPEPEVEEMDKPSIEIGELATQTSRRMPVQEVMLRGYVE